MSPCNNCGNKYEDKVEGCTSCLNKCHEVVDTLEEAYRFRNTFVTVREENAVYHVDNVGNVVGTSRDPLYIDNYTPVTGDYKSNIVYDPANDRIYFFDDDGNFVVGPFGDALLKSGGAMSGDIDMSGNFIRNSPDPQEQDDLTTKQYVDTAVATGGLTPAANLVTLAGAQTLTNKTINNSTIGSSTNVIEVLKKAYPLGSIYLSVLNTNPSALLGFGTWQVFGTGRTIVGVDGSQSEFAGAETIGGQKRVTLSVAEMPSHSHYYETPLRLADTDRGGNSSAWSIDNVNGYDTGSTGGGQSHDNMPPYITLFMFKRTA